MDEALSCGACTPSLPPRDMGFSTTVVAIGQTGEFALSFSRDGFTSTSIETGASDAKRRGSLVLRRDALEDDDDSPLEL